MMHAPTATTAPYRVDDFGFDLRRAVTPASHIWVGSGFATVAPAERRVLGVRGLHTPPFTAPDLALDVAIEVDGHRILDQGSLQKGDVGLLLSGHDWYPNRFERRGTFHHLVDGRLISIGIRSTLVPLHDAHGFALEVQLTNRSGRAVPVVFGSEVAPGAVGSVPLGEWDYGWPRFEAQPMVRTSAHEWSSAQLRLVSLTDGAERRSLEDGASCTARFGVVLFDQDDTVPPADGMGAAAGRTRETWERRVEAATAALPRLSSDVPGLEAYYRRSLVSGLICLWDNPQFAIRPFPAVSGIEGAGICCYPWDIGGYAARAAALMLGAQGTQDLLHLMVSSGIDEHSRFSPNGTGNDVPYAYSVWAFVNLVWAAASVAEPDAELLAAARRMLDAQQADAVHWNGLSDFGPQPELLEMRGAGYEHVVASPNAEHAWVLDRFVELAELLGLAEEYPVVEWAQQADSIRAGIRAHLWDDDRGWFRAVYPDGHDEYIYSIQYFDALRFGACTPAMRERLLEHVRDGAFLGEYGVSSVSAEDQLHYELNDPDWSGAGAYTGDGPILALTLWEQGEPDKAWDVLRRHLWMGAQLPYFPQEHYADRPVVPEHKRANVIAGLSGVEAIVFGLFGVEPRPDGTTVVCPSAVPQRSVLSDLRIRGHRIDIELESHRLRVTLDDVVVHDGEIRRVDLDPRRMG